MKDNSLNIMAENKIHKQHERNLKNISNIEKARQESLAKRKRKIKGIKVAAVSVVTAITLAGAITWGACITAAVDFLNGAHRDKNGSTFDNNGKGVEIPLKEYLFPSQEAKELAKKIMLGQVKLDELGDTASLDSSNSISRGSM